MNEAMQVEKGASSEKMAEQRLGKIIGQVLNAEQISFVDAKFLRIHVDLLKRQAQKAKNQRTALRSLNKSHRAIVMENRWLRSKLDGLTPYMDQARKTLWSLFRRENPERERDVNSES